MKASLLYKQLEKDFINSKLSDDWAPYMHSIDEFLCENFKKRSMGLVCDFAEEISKVYTAVFPSKKVLQEILDKNTHDAMLFVHHPSIWDIRKAPKCFHQMDLNLLKQFKDRRISIYNLHVPLDNYSKCSTSSTLAKALGLTSLKPFLLYFGGIVGVYGKTSCKTINDLQKKFESAVGHKTKLYFYGDKEIYRKTVAVVAGGGLTESLGDILKSDAKIFITGISVKNNYSEKFHNSYEKNKISILGGTHYSTEKFACIAMADYFKKMGLPSEFIEDEPVMEDM